MEVDFQKLILDLMQKDMSLTDIANAAGVDKSTVSLYLHKHRKQPTYETGAKLVALHEEVCGESAN